MQIADLNVNSDKSILLHFNKPYVDRHALKSKCFTPFLIKLFANCVYLIYVPCLIQWQ